MILVATGRSYGGRVQSDPMLPTFLVVGSMKSGTTSLHRMLGAHPQIFTAPRKEIEFFSEERNWRLGLDWYRNHFASCGDVRARGESSTGYTKFPRYPEAPARIAQVLPWVRVLYLVRDPIARMVSHHAHNVIDGYETRPVDDALLHGDNYRDVSRYAMQISRYVEVLGPDRVKVVFTEDLHDRPADTLRDLYAFLGVDHFEPPPDGSDVSQRHNVTEGRPQIRRGLRHLSHTWLWRRLRDRAPEGLRAATGRITRRSVAITTVRQEPSPAAVAALVEQLQPDVDRLAEIAGRIPASWSIQPR